MVPREEENEKTLLWFLVIGILAVGASFYFKNEIKDQIKGTKISAYASKAVPPFRNTSDSQPIRAANPKSPTVGSTKGKFTFFPDQKNRFAWSVKYPDGRTFKLGEQFSSDCPPVVGRATAPATVRFEFNEQRSCNPSLRKSVEVEAEFLKDVNADGSPEVIAAILTGGNVNGHTSSLISLTPKGPKVVRRLD